MPRNPPSGRPPRGGSGSSGGGRPGGGGRSGGGSGGASGGGRSGGSGRPGGGSGRPGDGGARSGGSDRGGAGGRPGGPRGGGDRPFRPAQSRPRRQPPAPRATGPLRLQVFLARAGVASRRASEELIAEGRVMVNGARVTEPGTKVDPRADRVTVDGTQVELQRLVWVALHKPRGYVTTRDDPEGRRTVYDLLPREMHYLFHVGRLDRQSEGLLLLTNDGDVANRLLHPRYGVDKEYVATVESTPTHEALERLVEGVEVDGELFHAESVEALPTSEPGTTRLRLILREGRYREVRRMLEAVGHPVTKLVRRRFGPIRLGKLPRGEWRELAADELDTLQGVGLRTPPSS